ncbi:MAG: helix-turn-helix domain-containing protein [Rikenellaceae bacterium]
MELKKNILYRVEQFNDSDVEELFNTPSLVYGGGFMVCVEGSCTVLINAKSYLVERFDLIVISPYSAVQVENLSSDFDCSIIGVELDFFSHIELPNKGDYFINIRSHPSIRLSGDELSEILELKGLLLREEQNTQRPFFSEVHTLILKIITFKILAIYSNREPNREMVQSRNEKIFNAYIFDLLKFSHRERKVEFYAQRQSITPSYLSRCVKAAVGKNASELIVESVINNIKIRLQDQALSITQVAEEFHFGSSSEFSQYFKKHTSLSPRQYRVQRSGQPIKTLLKE